LRQLLFAEIYFSGISKVKFCLGWRVLYESFIDCLFLFQVLVLKLLTFGEENKRCPHQHLKVVEILEFTGEAVKVELALYIIENAVVLENIIFDTRNPVLIGTQWEFKESKDRKMGRRCARKLGAKLHLGVT
jgi:hypothetical protein